MLDFDRSFVFFESDFEAHPPKMVSDLRQNVHNRARIRIDCHLRLTDQSCTTLGEPLLRGRSRNRVQKQPIRCCLTRD